MRFPDALGQKELAHAEEARERERELLRVSDFLIRLSLFALVLNCRSSLLVLARDRTSY